MKRLNMSFKEIPVGARVAIYGTGARGRNYHKIMSVCRPDIVIVCFLDSFKEDNNSYPPILNISNVNPERLDVEFIFICSDFYFEIMVRVRESAFASYSSIEIYLADWFVDSLSADELEMCEPMYKKLFDKFSNEPFIYDALGRLKRQQNDLEASLYFYETAIKKFPNDILSNVGYAKALLDMNRYEESEEMYRSIVTRFSDSLAGYLGCASILRVMNRYAESEEVWRSVITRFPDNPVGYVGCADALLAMNRYEESEEMYKSVVTRFSDNPAGYLGYSGALFVMNRHEESEGMYRSVITQFPEDPAGYLGLANVLAETKKYTEVENILLSAKKVAPSHLKILLALKYAYIAQEKYSEAREVLLEIKHAHKNSNKRTLNDPKRLLFEHIPKCGGTTVGNYLNQIYSYSEIYSQVIVYPWGQKVDSFYSFLSDDEKLYYSLIIGFDSVHFPEDSHGMLKVTVLRDPVDRAISSYYYALQQQWISRDVTLRKFIQDLFAPGDVDRLPFSRYSCNVFQHTRPYIQHFSTDTDRMLLSGEDLVWKCCSYIERFDLVGVTEKMDAFLEKLQNMANLPIPYSGFKRNVTTKRKKMSEIDQNTVDFIKDYLKLDIAIYEFVKMQWARQEKTG